MRADSAAAGGGAFTTTFVPICDIDSSRVQALVASVGWKRSFGTLDLVEPDNFRILVNRQAELAATAAHIVLERLKSVFAEADALGHADLPIVVALPSILLSPDAGALAMPNLVSPFLDRRECARTVILVDAVPIGGGQALRLLSDRGLSIAMTSGAAAAADPADLAGWQRWGVIFPPHVVQGPNGIDRLTIQQTASAVATHDTRLIAMADEWVDTRELALNNVRLTVDPKHPHVSVRESVGSRVGRQQ